MRWVWAAIATVAAFALLLIALKLHSTPAQASLAVPGCGEYAHRPCYVRVVQ